MSGRHIAVGTLWRSLPVARCTCGWESKGYYRSSRAAADAARKHEEDSRAAELKEGELREPPMPSDVEVPEEAYRLAEGAVAHGDACAGGEAAPGVLAELAVDAATPAIREQERERVRGELQDAFDHILNIESKLPGLHDVFDRVFPGWDATPDCQEAGHG